MNTEKKDHRIVPGIVLFLICASLAWVFFADRLTLDAVRAGAETMEGFIEDHPVLSSLTFILVYVCVVVFAMPAASILTMAAGFAFPFYWALPMVLCAASFGAMMLFLLVRSSLRPTFEKKADKAYRKIQVFFAQKPLSTLLFLRFFPVFPFFLVNIAVGLLEIRIWTAFWTCFVGIIPGTALYVLLGRQLSVVDNPADLVGWEFLAIMTALAFLSLLPRWLKKRGEYPLGGGERDV